MNPPPILPRIAGALEHLAIPYMLSGSFASSHHGAPRTTDAILSKLEWATIGVSDRQLADVSGIVRTQGTTLDRAYVEEWVDDLGVRELWLWVLAAL